MQIHRTAVGSSRGHSEQGPRPVDLYTIESGSGLAIEVLTYGAHLVGCHLPDRNGAGANVVLRLPDLASYETRSRNPYVGATVGPYAFRIARARLDLDGHTHVLDANDGPHCLHGGRVGFDRYVWTAETDRGPHHAEIRLGLVTAAGVGGFPGNLEVTTTYRVDDRLGLVFEHTARTDAVTVLNMTNHAYWNLRGSGSVLDHELTLAASTHLPADGAVIPTGPPEPVDGTPYDFTTPRSIRPGRIDTFFPLAGVDADWAAVLHDPVTGRTMRVRTDQPGVNVYTADKFDPPNAGICLETGRAPDAPNRPELGSAVLRPGEIYRHRTEHVFAAA